MNTKRVLYLAILCFATVYCLKAKRSPYDTSSKSPGSSFYDAFLIKFDSSGNRIWTRLFGAPGNTITRAYSITRSPDDYYYITGSTNGIVNGQTLIGISDMLVAKYDSNGNLLLTKLLGVAGATTEGRGLAFDSNNTIYVSGFTNGDYDGITNPAKPNYSYFITRFVK